MKEKIIGALKEMKDSDLIYIHNEYCDKVNYTDDTIFYMYDIDEVTNIENLTLTEILEKYGDVDTRCTYFVFTIYGLEGFDDLEDRISFRDMADYIIENDEDFESSDIREILDDEEEEV